jgi:tripartite-type tricarboxylate transporter receptor subunit TctC
MNRNVGAIPQRDGVTRNHTPEEFAATIKSEMAKWSQLIRDAGIRE